MNWTGGVLDRSRNGKSSLTTKQKAHFAKAKGRPNTTHTSPPTFEIFGNISRQTVAHTTPTSRARGNLHRNNQRLGLAQYHGSRRSSQLERKSSMSRAESSSYLRNTTRCSPIIISSRQSSISAFDEDGYISPPSQIERGSKQLSQDRPASMPIATEIQRDRLLNMLDWVGISHTKPAKIDFTDFHDRDQIGKRRRLSDMKHQSHKPKRQWYESRSQRPLQGSSAPNDLFSQADVSVRIDSVFDSRGVRDERERRSSSKLDHASTVSDEMLLDEGLSDKIVSSHNPFKERLLVAQINRAQQPQNYGLTPSACIYEPEHFRTEAKSGQTSEYDYKAFEVQEGPSDFGQDLPLPRSLDGPGLIVKLSGEDHAPSRFVSEDAPPLRDGSSGPKTGSSREQNSDFERSKAGSKRLISRGTQQNSLAVAALTVQDSPAKPRFFDIPSLSCETRDCLNQLSDSIPTPAYLADQLQNVGPRVIRQKDHINLRTRAIDKGNLRPSSQTNVDTVTLTSRPIFEYEEETGKRFINENPPVQLLRTEGNQPVPNICAAEEASSEKVKNLEATIDEDEALWRNFVFGGESSTLDWIVELKEGEAAVMPKGAASTDPAAQTQSSMEAEIATSPIKRNAHLMEEAVSSSQGARTNRASQIATVCSTLQANSDKMLDGENHDSGSTIHETQTTAVNTHSPSSNVAQASTSPPTTVDAYDENIIPSSLIVQARTPNIPIQPSSDELSWSPVRLSQSATGQKVIFKKPTRYVGERSSDPLQPVRLGRKGKVGRPNTKKGKRLREEPVEGRAEDEEIWQIGPEQEGILEDDIEDF